MATSSDPNVTSGKANSAETSLSFPLNEKLEHSTRLRFVKYSRTAPNANGSEDTTAMLTLPLPISIPDSYSIRTTGTFDQGVYAMLDLANLEKAKDVATAAAEAISAGTALVTDNLKMMEESFKANALKALALSPLMIADDVKTNLQIAAGVVTNPHTTLVFDGVNLKQYSLTWRMSPRSLQESEALNRIINTMKMCSHPEEAFGGYALDYPDLVYVEFSGTSAQYLPKFHKSMVNNVMINYGGGNGMTFYKSGAPVEVEITLSLMEVRIITRKVLREDGLG